MGTNPARIKSPLNPVETVSWNDCQACLDDCSGELRLPGEAEWEYACCAGTTVVFAGDLDAMTWFSDNALDRLSESRSHTAGSALADSWGLHDMHGNVLEWCEDLESGYIRCKAISLHRFRAARAGSSAD